MKASPINRKSERGIALVETAIVMLVFLTVMFGVLEISRLLWTVNVLTDATRRGARYAVVNSADSDAVKNLVVYGSTGGGTNPVVNGLTTTDVDVAYSANFGLGSGRVTVRITNYPFQFVVPLVGTSFDLPEFKTTLTGESAGVPPP